MPCEKCRRMPTSKKVMWLSWAIFAIMLLCLLYGVFFTEKDMTPLTMVFCVDGLINGTATTAYFWKAKAEKKLELFERMASRWEEKYGLDAVTALASVILTEH